MTLEHRKVTISFLISTPKTKKDMERIIQEEIYVMYHKLEKHGVVNLLQQEFEAKKI